MSGPCWVVVGGSSQGGILVREGEDVSSPQAPARLSIGAVVSQLALVGDRLHYALLTGTGPDRGWVSTRLKGKELLTDICNVWVVVGGSDKGGILVREGKDTASPQSPERLSTGALVREQELDGERFHFERITGKGPVSGWVSTRLGTGKDLLVRAEAGLGAVQVPEQIQTPHRSGPPLEIRMVNEEMSFSYEGLPAWVPRAAAVARLWREGQPYLPSAEEISSWKANLKPYGEVKAANPFKPVPPKKLAEISVQQRPGLFFGMMFPRNLEQLMSADFGPDWLTRAFHMAGTLPQDNKITKLVRGSVLPKSGMDTAGGAGEKALFTVEYLRADPELHAELFVKYPYAYEESPRMRHYLSGQFDNDFPEVGVNLYLTPLFPFLTPKTYFAEFSRETTNWILISETIMYEQRGKIKDVKLVEQQKALGPYKILPGCGKCQDYLLPNIQEFYFAIFRMMGRLAAWDKLGRYDDFLGLATSYNQAQYLESTKHDRQPQSLQTKDVTMQAIRKQSDKGVDFVLNVGSKLFPPDVCDPLKLESMADELVAMSPYFFDMQRYFQANHSDYVAAMHVNLQADNAFFWRDEYGNMDCGCFDWGNFNRSPFCVNFLGVTNSIETESLIEHLDSMFAFFMDEYHRCGGPKLSLEEMKLRYHLGFVVAIVDAFQWLERSVYKETSRDEFLSMESMQDERFQARWETRCRCTGLVFSIAYYIKRGGLKSLFDEWAAGAGRPYLTVYR